MSSARSGRCDRFRGRILFLFNRDPYHHHDAHGGADRRVQSFDGRKSAHYPHPRPAIEQKAAPTNQEPHHARVTPGTNETTLATDLSAQDQSTKDWRAASATKTDTENRKPERKIKPERLAHLHQPKVLARQQQNYEGYGYGMALGYAAEGYHPGLDSQR